MTPNQEQDNASTADGSEGVLEEVHQLDEHLHDELVEDGRLSDGVPDAQRTDDLDFIQMSGLARSDAEPEPATSPASEPDADGSRPVSFFEKGVADVDPEMVPGTVVAHSSEDEELASTTEAEPPAAEIADILAQLEVEDESAGTPESEMPIEPDPGPPAGDAAEEGPADAEDIAKIPGEAAIEGIEELAELAADAGKPVEDASEPTQEPALDEIEEILVALEAELPADPGDDELDAPEPEPPDESIMEEAAPVEPVEEAAPIEPDPPDEAAVEPPADAGTPMPSADLLEAERLVEELEDQPRETDLEPPSMVEADVALVDEAAPAPTAISDDVIDEEVDEETDDVVYDRPLSRRGGRRRSKGLRTGSRRRIIRIVLLVAAVLVVIVGAYMTREWTRDYWETPEALFEQAKALEANGEFARASSAFSNFAALYPQDRRRPEAQFLSASVLRRIHPEGPGEAKRVAEQALDGFEMFIRENPAYEDAKLARAEVLKGVLYFELGEYEKALTVLGDQDLRLRDPGAELSILRTLAEARDRLGDYGAALKLYGEAAGDADNASRDRDYESLAQLYENMSDRATSTPERRNYDGLALEHWRKARNVPGLSPLRAREVEVKIGLLEGRSGIKETRTGVPSASGQENTGPAEGP